MLMPNARLARLAISLILLFTPGVTAISGAVVAGVTAQLRRAERGTHQETTTNASGVYVFPSVQPGVYRITVRKEGFQSENVRPA
jgi:hypothetical protein